MRELEKGFTFEEYVEVINEFAPCMDGYPYLYDLEKEIYYISEKALEHFVIPSNQFSNVIEMHKKFVYEEDLPILIETLQKMRAGEKDEQDIECRWMSKDGKPLWVNCRGRIIKDENGSVKYLLGCVNEIAVRRKADNATGLKSISTMMETLETFCRVAAGGYTLHIGVDNFKVINERFGHEYGDFILHGVADCIESCIGPGQEVYHVITDEFLVVDYFSDSADGAKELYDAICAKIDKFIAKNRYETVFSISGGVLSCTELGGMAFDEFIKLSQFALNYAKKQGKNQVYFFRLEDYEMFLYKSNILSALKESISAEYEGFDVLFQPVPMGTDENLIPEVQAVLSYTLPNGAALPAQEFIPVLEESGLIIPVGKWMIDKAIAFCKEEQTNIPDIIVNVKIPYVKVLKSPFIMAFIGGLTDYGVELPLDEIESELENRADQVVRGLGVRIRIEAMGEDLPANIQVFVE